MRTFEHLVLDAQLDESTSYRSDLWAELLGTAELLVVTVSATFVSGTSPTFSLELRGSGDAFVHDSLVKVLVSSVALSTAGETTLKATFGPADGGYPATGALVLAPTLGGVAPRARVRMWVAGRGEAAPPLADGSSRDPAAALAVALRQARAMTGRLTAASAGAIAPESLLSSGKS